MDSAHCSIIRHCFLGRFRETYAVDSDRTKEKEYQDSRDVITRGLVKDLQHYYQQLSEIDSELEKMYHNGNMIVAGRTHNNLPDFKNIGRFIDFIPGH